MRRKLVRVLFVALPIALVVLLVGRFLVFFAVTLRDEVRCRRTPEIRPLLVAQGQAGRAVIDRIQSYDSEAFSRFAAQDKDGDGLTAGEELARLSSDGKIDTDGDGVLDPSDLSPNLRSAGTLRGRLEGKLLDNIISDWAHTFDPTLLLYITYVSCDTPVIRDPAVTTIMANKHDYPLLVALFNPRQYIELTNLFYIPGFAYGYHVLINCGDRCRHTEYVVLLDFPLFGLNRLFRIPVDQNIWAVYTI